MRVDRDGAVGVVTIQNHGCLNAEDDARRGRWRSPSTSCCSTTRSRWACCAAGPATHPKHAGRRIFGAGINLTHLYTGQISLVEFMLERELGAITKMYRGHAVGSDLSAARRDDAREKPWVAVVESFAIGGACQWLLVMDRVIAETGSYFNLPARKEGIIPGCANLRLPAAGGRAAGAPGDLLRPHVCGRQPRGPAHRRRGVLDRGDRRGCVALRRAAAERRARPAWWPTAGRCACAQEPLDAFRRYMSVYASEQARCLYSPALIDNLERNWRAAQRVS